MKPDIKQMVEYIERNLNENPQWFEKYRDMYLDICKKAKLYDNLSPKQIEVLKIAFNLIFDKIN
jgi:hypothetical protein